MWDRVLHDLFLSVRKRCNCSLRSRQSPNKAPRTPTAHTRTLHTHLTSQSHTPPPRTSYRAHTSRVAVGMRIALTCDVGPIRCLSGIQDSFCSCRRCHTIMFRFTKSQPRTGHTRTGHTKHVHALFHCSLYTVSGSERVDDDLTRIVIIETDTCS